MSNTPDFTNAEYKKYENALQFIDDMYQGSFVSKEHIDFFESESQNSKNERTNSAVQDNYLKRTINSMANIIFRKDLDLSAFDKTQYEDLFKTIDLQNNLNTFAKDLIINYIKDGKTYIVIDSPQIDSDISKEQARKNGIRPYFVNILRKQVVNWLKDDKGNFKHLTIEEDYNSPFGTFDYEVKQQQRVFYSDGTVEIWRDGERIETLQNSLGIMPIIELDGENIPMVYDLAKYNKLLMNRVSEYNRYIRMASVVTPLGWNMPTSEDGSTVKLSVTDGVFFNAPPSEADFMYRGVDAQNFTAIQDNIKTLIDSMLNIAVTFASSSKIKTATEVDKDKTEDESKLVDIANEIEHGLNQSIKIMGLYLKENNLDKEVSINKDYNSNKLTPQDRQQIREDYASGLITLDMALDAFMTGEVYEIKDKEKIKAELNNQGLIE